VRIHLHFAKKKCIRIPLFIKVVGTYGRGSGGRSIIGAAYCVPSSDDESSPSSSSVKEGGTLTSSSSSVKEGGALRLLGAVLDSRNSSTSSAMGINRDWMVTCFGLSGVVVFLFGLLRSSVDALQ
jgi:hypothetical protein